MAAASEYFFQKEKERQYLMKKQLGSVKPYENS